MLGMGLGKEPEKGQDAPFTSFNDGSSMPQATSSPPLSAGSVQSAPPVPGGSATPGKGVTAVNTEAMKTFANNLSELVADGGPLKTAGQNLTTVNVKAGGFRSAVNLAGKINGSGQLADATATAIQQTVQAITDVRDAMLKMASDYSSAEDANKMTSDSYAKYLGTAAGQIKQIASSGGSSGTSSN